jgi:pyruvate-ferredoxin/flavodoxin oxidoreductase
VLPRDEAIAKIKAAIAKTYGKKGAAEVVRATSPRSTPRSRSTLREVPTAALTERARPPACGRAPDFVQRVTAQLDGAGDLLPVSAFPPTAPGPRHHASGRSAPRLRDPGVGSDDLHPVQQVRDGLPPRRDPHQAVFEPRRAGRRARGLPGVPWKGDERAAGPRTPCRSRPRTAPAAACASRCARPRTNGQPAPQGPRHGRAAHRARRRARALPFFLELPEVAGREVKPTEELAAAAPLFEFSGACAGCGETPYMKLLTQLFGDRLIIANATGCSSIYGGNLPTTPYTTNGRGPRPGVGQLALRGQRRVRPRHPLGGRRPRRGRARCSRAGAAPRRGARRRLRRARLTTDEAGWRERSARGSRSCASWLDGRDDPKARRSRAPETSSRAAVWLVGGDGWAYDIGYGGLDHVLATGRDVNIWCSTPRSTRTPVASSRRPRRSAPWRSSPPPARRRQEGPRPARDELRPRLRRQIAIGARSAQTVQALQEAEAFPARRW